MLKTVKGRHQVLNFLFRLHEPPHVLLLALDSNLKRRDLCLKRYFDTLFDIPLKLSPRAALMAAPAPGGSSCWIRSTVPLCNAAGDGLVAIPAYSDTTS
jgi:hypothetical protein